MGWPQAEGGEIVKPFIIVDCEQRSEAWFTARLGRLTASRAADMLGTRRDKTESAGRRNLRVQLVLERVTGRCMENGYVSPAMEQGIAREADAAALYEALTGRLLDRSGFLAHPTLMAGCSLDGHVGDFEGIVEIKSPIPATHLDYLKTGQIPDEYLKQIVHQLWMTGAQWCDWLSYNPDFPEPLQTKLVRVTRDEKILADYERAVVDFLAEVQREYDGVLALMEKAAA